MCVYSAYVDQVKPFLPAPHNPDYSPGWLPFKPSITPDFAKELKEIAERLDRIDKALGLRECSAEADAKAAFIKQLEELIAANAVHDEPAV